MKSLILAAALVVAGAAFGSEEVHWGYCGAAGPDHWAELSQEYALCATGKNQSPINLTGFMKADLPSLKFQYETGGTEVVNNGHAIQVNYAPGSELVADGREYELKQYHFHAPSENLVDGKSFPMEVHLVHRDKDGNLAVVAVMFVEGKANPALVPAWERMPEKKNVTQKLSTRAAAEKMLPENRGYYRYNGSLTTPPCSEGVLWLVMKEPVTASRAQINQFTGVMHHDNNRPVQPLNGRTVLQ